MLLIAQSLEDARDLMATAQRSEQLRRRSKLLSKLGVLAFHFGLRCPQADLISTNGAETVGTFDARVLAITLTAILGSDDLREEACKQRSGPGDNVSPLYAFSGN
jgi:hypothetical protein